MKRDITIVSLAVVFVLCCMMLITSSCANIIPPTGGPRDSLPPVLVNALPSDSSTHFSSNKITLSFDEYVTVENANDNLIVSPFPKNPPIIDSKLRTVTIKLKDTLEPNTTYSFNFGKGLKDVNEGNFDSSFRYVFTTGSKLDENTLRGKVLLAENGKTDTTLIVVLQNNLNDTAILKDRPRYYTKLNGKGNFVFSNLPKDSFNVFVLPNDYSKRYDDSTKIFAFLPAPVYVSDTSGKPVTLYAYHEFKDEGRRLVSNSTSNSGKKEQSKRKKDTTLKITPEFDNGKQDFLKSLSLTVSDTVQVFDTAKFHLSDTNYTALPDAQLALDTSATRIQLSYKWTENTFYKLVIEKDAVKDSSGRMLKENDTLSFSTLKESDYGSIRIRFQNLDTAKHPVLLLVQNDNIVTAVPLTSYEWYRKFFRPGDYEMRMLYDTNGNGVWDAGSYASKHEPEIVQTLNTKGSNRITIRANWDNEQNITL